MKWKKNVLSLSLSLVLFTTNTMIINAEDEMRTEEVIEILEEPVQETSPVEVFDEIPETMSPETESVELIESESGEIPFEIENKDEDPSEYSTEEIETENVDELTDNTDIIMTDGKEIFNLKLSIGFIETSDIFVGEHSEGSLKVECLDGENRIQLEKNYYAVMGYVTEEQFKEADYTLDNLNEFKEVPDSAGKWYLIYEGVIPYYGRQAVYVTVHDQHDLSIYNWTVDNDVVVGEDPRESLKVFQKNSEDKNLTESEDYKVLGYVSEEDYKEAFYSLDQLSNFEETPDCAGNWLLVVEGCGEYHGRQAGWITVKDSKDIGAYQCQIIVERINQGDDIKASIEVLRNKYGVSRVVEKEAYQVVGYVNEKDFSQGGYDLNNIENIQEFVDSIGGWYAVIEGVQPYSGRTVGWFEMQDIEKVEDTGVE